VSQSSQLLSLKELLENPSVSDSVLQFYLDCARDIICELRNTDMIETKYLTIQIRMAVEMFNKIGAEGQIGHSENGIARTYEKADISDSLLSKITPAVKTPFSETRIVTS
jgi:hypothetical protein